MGHAGGQGRCPALRVWEKSGKERFGGEGRGPDHLLHCEFLQSVFECPAPPVIDTQITPPQAPRLRLKFPGGDQVPALPGWQLRQGRRLPASGGHLAQAPGTG